jgi:hypothetical protein|tara:strand:+ start:164 stop:319 length:156 start_codon:yes stop_codon:yes gene_type:complete
MTMVVKISYLILLCVTASSDVYDAGTTNVYGAGTTIKQTINQWCFIFINHQ